MQRLDKFVILTGPTCIGKTDISVKIMQNMPDIEIIAADSMQIYKYMNIGTAKPDRDILGKYRHHCLDIVEPSDHFDVMKYTDCVKKCIKELLAYDKKPFIVGGSGLYIKALIKPIFKGPSRNQKIRKHLLQLFNQKGNLYLFNQLKKYDTEYSKKINPNDTKRIIRALEVYYLTGKPLSYFHQKKDDAQINHHDSPNRYYTICLYMNREKLYQRINYRVEQMIKKGLLEETKELLKKYKNHHLNAMQALGYKQIISYLEGHITFDETIELIKKETRNFAKRQMTWFKNQIEVDYWINRDDFKSTEKIAEKIVTLMEKNGY